MTALPDHLSLEDTTPVTEAVENCVDEATRSLRDITYQLQSAISIASNPKQGADEAFVVQTSRLGLALVHGYVSAWSTAVDGLALIADDEAEWWWTAQLELLFAEEDRHGVVRVTVTTIPQGVTIPKRWVRVARDKGKGQVDLIDRGAGVPPKWDGKCYVSVRQHGDFTPGAVRIFFRMVDAAGHSIASAPTPIDAVLSL